MRHPLVLREANCWQLSLKLAGEGGLTDTEKPVDQIGRCHGNLVSWAARFGLYTAFVGARYFEVNLSLKLGSPNHFRLWPIATDDILTARRRFRGIADMDRFSSRNDL